MQIAKNKAVVAIYTLRFLIVKIEFSNLAVLKLEDQTYKTV